MPQGSNANKSGSRKKKGPAHQNAFAFQHNPKSKKTERILNLPIKNVCRRCMEKIEWRKKYRKYKPRTQPGKCNLCGKRNVRAAYHTICTTCTTSEKAYKSILKTERQRSVQETSAEHASMDCVSEEELAHSASELSVEEDDHESQSFPRVCAMCVKEPALPDEDDGPESVDDVLARENRRLKLRERRTLERKLVREQEEAKQAAKEEKRREREEGQTAKDAERGSNGQHADDIDVESDHMESTNASGDEEDPFLQQVGGESKLLVGDAFHRMLLEREER